MWSEARSVLERYFGYRQFRPGQREAIGSVLAGRDTLVVMPTGGGKSLCFQVPALVRPGLTLVVSPLIALMQDQVNSLECRGIAAALVNSTLTGSEIEGRLARAVDGRLKLLYVAPERFASPAFRRAVQRMDVKLVAVDEAHCVCEWGHDFRPSYLQLRRAWPWMGQPQLLALTATATPEVRRDIVRDLALSDARILVHGFDRPNLRLRVVREDKLAEKGAALVSLVSRRDEAALVYASTRKMVEAAAELLRSAGVSAAAYHAGLPQEQRARVQEEWTSGRLPVVVATNAFGMGIDKEDVRRVIHFQMPGSLEAYYQEAGRAGRDGEPADCVLLHSYGDRFIHEFFIRQAHPSRGVILSAYRALCAAARSAGGPVVPGRFAHQVKGLKSRGELHSALRILADAGCVQHSVSQLGCSVRWVAAPDSIQALLAGANDPAQPDPALPVLEGLARLSRYGERRRFRVSRHDIARWAGEFSAGRAALDALQNAGLLGWRDDTAQSGYQPRQPAPPEQALPVDWDRVARLRDLETGKLRRMESYAFQRGCRRRYLLGYFGERLGRSRCGGCDRCGTPLSSA